MSSECDKPWTFVILRWLRSNTLKISLVVGCFGLFFFNAAVISNMNSVPKFDSPFDKVFWHHIGNPGEP